MADIVGKIGKIFGMNSDELENRRMLKENDRKNKKLISELDKYSDCDVKLQKCDEEFRRVIEREKMLIREREMNVLPTADNKKRVRHAAIGRLVVRTARLELKEGTNSDRLNKAMNGLGVSIRQLNKLHTTDVKEKNLDAIIEVLGRSGEDVEAAKLYLENLETYTVPEEINSLVDDTFVEEILLTDNMEFCINKGRRRYQERKREKEEKKNAVQLKASDASGAGSTGSSVDDIDVVDDIDPKDIRGPEDTGSGETETKSADKPVDPKEAYKKISKENAKFY